MATTLNPQNPMVPTGGAVLSHEDAPVKLLEKEDIGVYYEIVPNIRVLARMSMRGMNTADQYFEGTFGIRRLSDTRLTKGAKVIFRERDDQNTRYMSRVLDIRREDGEDVHRLSMPSPYDPDALEMGARLEVSVKVFRPETFSIEQAKLKVGNSITFVHNSSLTSAKLDKAFEIYLHFGSKSYPFQCKVRRITYNWWIQHHQVDAEFVDLTQEQEQILQAIYGRLEMLYGSPEEASQAEALQADSDEAVGMVDKVTVHNPENQVPDVEEEAPSPDELMAGLEAEAQTDDTDYHKIRLTDEPVDLGKAAGLEVEKSQKNASPVTASDEFVIQEVATLPEMDEMPAEPQEKPADTPAEPQEKVRQRGTIIDPVTGRIRDDLSKDAEETSEVEMKEKGTVVDPATGRIRFDV